MKVLLDAVSSFLNTVTSFDFVTENIQKIEHVSLLFQILAALLTGVAVLVFDFMSKEAKDAYTNTRSVWEKAEAVFVAFLAQTDGFEFLSTQSSMLSFCRIFAIVLLGTFIINLIFNIISWFDYLMEKGYFWSTIISLVADLMFIVYAFTKLIVLSYGIA